MTISRNLLTAHVLDDYPAIARDDAKTVAQIAAIIVDTAGQGGGIAEIDSLAHSGWPTNRPLEIDGQFAADYEAAIRGAIQRAAKMEIASLSDEAAQ